MYAHAPSPEILCHGTAAQPPGPCSPARQRITGQLAIRLLAASLLAMALWAGAAAPALGLVPERRRDFDDRRPNEYLIIPAVASLPGVGVFVGVISSFSNIGDSGIDAAAAIAESVDNTDISVLFGAVRELPLPFPGLTVDYIYGNVKLGNFQQYVPGRDSPNFTVPVTAEFDVQILQPAIRWFSRRFNLIYSLQYFDGFGIGEDGNEESFANYSATGSILLDLTDDVVDPRVGTRLGYSTTLDAPESSIFGGSKGGESVIGEDEEITVEQYQWTVYIPFSKQSVLVWDNQYFAASGQEDSDEVITGGDLPLRGYPAGRWSDRFGVFHAFEWRYTKFLGNRLDFFLANGILEGLQYALFYEVGQVSPEDDGSLYEEMHHSYGAGVRALFDAIVVRLDFANSDEGLQTHLVINQPF